MSVHVALVAPPWFQIPPRGYGGIEWICHWLVEGLAARGHRISLIAGGDSEHAGVELVQTYAETPSERLGETLPDLVHAAKARVAVERLRPDIVHDHSLAGPLSAGGHGTPTIVTAHGPPVGEMGEFYAHLPETVRLVSISHVQQRLAPHLPWAATVHNAIPVDSYPFSEEKEGYLLFLGRMGPEKGAHLAIDAARAAGIPLVLAGKCSEPREHRYFEQEVRPRLGDGVEWLGGPAATDRKKQLLAGAIALVFPIQWEEPFGIVMIEALACGTPVVALRGGSVDEVVDHEITGFVVDDPRDLPGAIEKVELIDPRACRARAQTLFDVPAMVTGYERVYEAALAEL